MLLEGIIQTGPGVFKADKNVTFLSADMIEWLKTQALDTEKKRARICLHKTGNDPVHEMVIAVHKSSFIPPHAHPHKEESFHVIEGACDVSVFDDQGNIIETKKLDAQKSPGSSYFYRIGSKTVHGMQLKTDWLVFHEVAAGPSKPDANYVPEWVPSFENDQAGVDWVNRGFPRA